MYNYFYLAKLRTDNIEMTPPLKTIYLFKDMLEEKDIMWLMFEEEILINKKPINMEFCDNLANLILIFNKNMSEQILKILYKNEYNPFKDKINLEWFNNSQRQYILKCQKELQNIETAKENILVGMFENEIFVLSEYSNKNVNVKDVFFQDGIGILFTYEENDSIVKIYFNPEKIEANNCVKMMKLIQKHFPNTNISLDGANITIDNEKINTIDIFKILNQEKRILINKEKKNEE